MSYRPAASAWQAQAAGSLDPLSKYRRYTTLTLAVMGPFFAVTAALSSSSLSTMVLCLVAGFPVTVIMTFWEHRPPIWLTAAAIIPAMAAWTLVIFRAEPPQSFVLATMAIALPLSHVRSHRLLWNIAGLIVLTSPVFVVAVVQGGPLRWGYIATALIGYGISWAVFRTNAYAWQLYVDLDEARAAEAELAVVQERFRMASDIHDIQGHTLHVIKLKLQLADRLLDAQPEAAHQHLHEARELVTETLANTRSLVYGDRFVTVSGELANAKQLLGAAGIDVTVTGASGTPEAGAITDELLGLLIRESTTNILRHADAAVVRISLNDHSVTIENDGARGGPTRLSGLARLGRRFEEAGGSLKTASDANTFQTTGVVS